MAHIATPFVTTGSTLRVLLDVRGVEKLRMPKATHGAALLVGDEYPPAEHALMKTLAGHCLGVLPSQGRVGWMEECRALPLIAKFSVDGDDELVVSWFLGDKTYRVDGRVNALSHTEEPDEGRSELHRTAERDVVVVVLLCAAPLVS
jgi:hypothetical protein